MTVTAWVFLVLFILAIMSIMNLKRDMEYMSMKALEAKKVLEGAKEQMLQQSYLIENLRSFFSFNGDKLIANVSLDIMSEEGEKIGRMENLTFGEYKALTTFINAYMHQGNITINAENEGTIKKNLNSEIKEMLKEFNLQDPDNKQQKT